MNWTIVIVIGAVAAVAYYDRKSGRKPASGAASAGAAPVPAPGPATPAAAPVAAAAGPAASYDDYRRLHPSNMRIGKLTCNECGSNLLRTASGLASCTNCGVSLYRA